MRTRCGGSTCWKNFGQLAIFERRFILEEADDKARELLEVFLAAELGVEQHDQVAGVGLGWSSLTIHHQYFTESITCCACMFW